MKHISYRGLGLVVGLLVVFGAGSAAAQAQSGLAGDEASSGALTHLGMLRQVVRSATEEMLDGMTLPTGEALTVIASHQHGANWLVADELASILSRSGYRVRIEKGVIEEPAPSTPPPPEAQQEDSGEERRPEGGEWQDDSFFEDDLEEGAEDSTAAEDEFGGDWEDEGEQEDQSDDILGALMEMEATTAASEPVATPKSSEAVAPARQLSGPVLEFRVIECAVKYVGVHRAYFLGPKRVERAALVDLSSRLIDGETREVRWTGAGEGIAVDRVAKSKLPLYESSDFTPPSLEEPGALRYVEPVLVGGIVTGLVYLFYTNQD